MKRRIVFLGPPASGKGTEAKKLSEKFSIPHISTGEIFREAMEADTELGRLARLFIDKGELVPDDVVLALVDGWIGANGTGKGFIFDGFPRTLRQAELFDEKLAKLQKPLDVVIWLEPTVEMIIYRIEGRRVCSECRTNYHLTRLPSKVVGKCDRCDAPLKQRPDDTKEMVLKRLKVYQEQTKGLFDYYQRQDKLRKIDGDLGPQEMFEEVLKAVV
ncbi:MAG: adenylate kinase [Verrucomicrobiae bacterium]|nr:adenylate kinase [Verrucomicrobiae bacterium]